MCSQRSQRIGWTGASARVDRSATERKATMTELLARDIEGTTALVTGANRGLGMAFVQALLDRGAAKVYAGARNPGTVDVTGARVVPVQLDITNPDDIAAAARACTDVSLLINNAGAMLLGPFLSAPDM